MPQIDAELRSRDVAPREGRHCSRAPLHSNLQQLHEVVEIHSCILCPASRPQFTGHLLNFLFGHLLTHSGEQVLQVCNFHHLWCHVNRLVSFEGGSTLRVGEEVSELHRVTLLRRLGCELSKLRLRCCNPKAAHHGADFLDLDACTLLVKELEYLLHLVLTGQCHRSTRKPFLVVPSPRLSEERGRRYWHLNP